MFCLSRHKTLAQKQMSLKEVIGNIENNYFVLPEMQRGYEWKPSDVICLADSLIKGLPIQQIITMQKSGSILGDGYRTLLGISQEIVIPTNAVLVFDGQQRLTSIGKIFIKNMNDKNYSFNIFNIIKYIFNLSDDDAFITTVSKNSKMNKGGKRTIC